MSHAAAHDIAWFTRIARILPLRSGDFDPLQKDGVWIHSTRPRHVVGRGAPGINVSVRTSNLKLLVGGQHAIIHWDDHTNIASIEDVSQNGTWVGEHRLQAGERVELTHNAVVWLGPRRHEKSAGFLFESFLAMNPYVRRYSLDMPLGSGAFGDVYQMRVRTEPSRVYAVKVAHYAPNGYGRSQAEVMEEVNTLRQVQDHPNICAIEEHYICSERNSIFVVMPRLGTDLHSHFTVHRLSISQAQTILKQGLEAINFIQGVLMVHRDIKPENIFILSLSPLIIVIGDFGLAYQVTIPSSGAPAFIYRAGTAWYQPPEIMDNAPLDDPFKFDNFSLGVAVAYMLMGPEATAGPWNRPFGSGSEVAYFKDRQLRWDLVQSIGMPSQCRSVLHGLTESEPAQRWSVQRALSYPWIANAHDASGQALPDPIPTIPFIDLVTEDDIEADDAVETGDAAEHSSALTPPSTSTEASSVAPRRSPRLSSSVAPRRSPRLAAAQPTAHTPNIKKLIPDGVKKATAKLKKPKPKKAPATKKVTERAKEAQKQTELRGRATRRLGKV